MDHVQRLPHLALSHLAQLFSQSPFLMRPVYNFPHIPNLQSGRQLQTSKEACLNKAP